MSYHLYKNYYLLSDDNVVDQTTAINACPGLMIPHLIQVFQDADLLVAISKGYNNYIKTDSKQISQLGWNVKWGYMLEDVGLNYQAKLYGF